MMTRLRETRGLEIDLYIYTFQMYNIWFSDLLYLILEMLSRCIDNEGIVRDSHIVYLVMSNNAWHPDCLFERDTSRQAAR